MVTKKNFAKEPLRSQVGRLVNFFVTYLPGELTRSQGAVDAAIRIIRTGLAPEIKVGDVVRLKSGGAEMTVSNLFPGGLAEVIWMSGYEKTLVAQRVPTIALSVVEKKKTQIAFDEGFKTKQA